MLRPGDHVIIPQRSKKKSRNNSNVLKNPRERWVKTMSPDFQAGIPTGVSHHTDFAAHDEQDREGDGARFPAPACSIFRKICL